MTLVCCRGMTLTNAGSEILRPSLASFPRRGQCATSLSRLTTPQTCPGQNIWLGWKGSPHDDDDVVNESVRERKQMVDDSIRRQSCDNDARLTS